LHWSSSIDPEPFTEGAIQPLEGTTERVVVPSSSLNYYEGVLDNTDISDPIGASDLVYEGEPASAATTIGLDASLNEFGQLQVMQIQDSVDAARLEPSQYSFYTWYQTGSGDNDWVYSVSTGEDYWNPIQPVILQNAVSDQYVTYEDKLGNQFTEHSLFLQSLVGASQFAVTSSFRPYGVTQSIPPFGNNLSPSYQVVETSGSYEILVTYLL